ncbi:MAG: PAS domain S-box protein [Syntrophales bacterium]
MNDQDKTEAELIEDNALLRQRIQELEQSESERKQAEEALRKREAKISSVFRAVPVGIGMVINRVIKEVNDTLCGMTGYDQEELIGKDSRILYPSDEDYEFVGREKYRQIAQKGAGTVETRWRRKDGEIINIILSSTAINPNDQSHGVTFTALDVTERKRAEEALRESETKFRALAESSSAAIFLIQDTKYIYINPAFETVIGYTMDDLANMNFWDFVHPDMREMIRDRGVSRLKGESQPSRYEIKFITKSGHERWVDYSATIIELENKPTIMGCTFDITERKQAEEALRDSKEQYRFVVENLNEVVFRTDAKGRWTFLNSAWAEVTGFAVEESLGKVFLEFVYPEDRQLNLELFRPLIERMKDYCRHEIRYMNKDGGFRWIEVWARLTLDENGNATGTAGTLTDITERKQAEQALRESEEKYRLVVENASEAIFIAQGGFLRFVNQATIQIMGYSEKEITSLPFTHFIHPEDKEMVLQRHMKRLKGEEVSPVYSFRIVTRNGKIRWMELHAVVISWKNEPATLNFLNDITDRKQAEEERQSLAERLQRAEKMEAIGILAGGVAHDLNNVLGIVVGYAEMLLMDTDRTSSIRSSLVHIMSGGQRAAAIVQDLLTLARRGVSGREVVNLNMIIADCQKTPEFEKLSSYHPSVKIKTDLEPNLLNISGSSVHLGKTLFNLVSNASEAMPKGGIMTIKTTNEYLDKPIQGYDEVREGDYVVLSVSDTGEGISATDLERIFEPFYTKKAMGRSGTGLGLAAVWGTVKDHNGYINVESEEGKGSTFTLYFPASREDVSSEADAVSITKYMGKGESILVVDDVKGQRDLAAGMLRKLNYNVSSVPSGEEAVAYLKEHSVDLVVLDMIMDPGMDGLDTYRSILEIHPKQKAVIVSGFSETDRVFIAQALGAGTYVRKPYVIEKLGLAVRKELDGK